MAWEKKLRVKIITTSATKQGGENEVRQKSFFSLHELKIIGDLQLYGSHKVRLKTLLLHLITLELEDKWINTFFVSKLLFAFPSIVHKIYQAIKYWSG